MVGPAFRMRMNRADQTFLAGALEVLETPPAPLASLMILTICLFFVAAVSWASYGKIDVIAVAQGKVQPMGRVKTVQSLRTGRVLELSVDNGAKVHRGDTLLRLDPREAIAERDAAAAELASYVAEVPRRESALSYAHGDFEQAAPIIAFAPGTLQAVRDRETRVLSADLASLTARLLKVRSETIQKQAERQKLDATVKAQRALIDVLQTRVSMRRTLVEMNAGTKANLIDADESLTTEQVTLAQEIGQTAEVDANLNVLARELRETVETFIADNAQKLDDAERQVTVLKQRLARAEVELDQMTVRSPIDGTVQSSSLTTIGQVVNPGEELMRIVPDSARLEIECYLPNKDIGFVKSGQSAVLKIESFPFTRYGTIDATVTRVGEDAIPEAEASLIEQDVGRTQREGQRAGADRMQNLVFPVTLHPKQLALDVDGTRAPLRTGMAVTVEIKTSQRRLIDYILSPIQKTTDEAMKER